MQKIWIYFLTLTACGIKYFSLDRTAELTDDLTLKPIAAAKVDALFDSLAKLDYIEFRYANNHCEDRAHAMCHYLEQHDIRPAKVWIFVKGIFKNKYPKVLKVADLNRINKDSLLTWKYHVAPTIARRHPTGRIDTVVLDPSLCRRPVLYSEWFEKMNFKKDLSTDDVFFLIKDWKFQSYPSVGKRPHLLKPWKEDPNFYLTRKGLCQGKISQAFLTEFPQDTTMRFKARKWEKLPTEYQDQLQPCMKELRKRIFLRSSRLK